MLNLRKHSILRKNSVIGKVIRLPLLLIPKHRVISIITGPLKGKKWIVGSHNHSAWLGTYERKQSLIFVDKCEGKHTLWDLGAHAGYYSLLFKTINSNSSVLAFEPVENNLRFLKKHIELNGLKNVFTFKNAVSNEEGVLKFARGNSVGGKLSGTGDMTVDVVKLSRLLKEKQIELPDVIKMDIEGAEYKVLKDIKPYLDSDKKPIIFLSTHGKEVQDKCLNLMKSIGYKITPLDINNTQNTKEYLLEP
jgi:FkbM family methyltransferase